MARRERRTIPKLRETWPSLDDSDGYAIQTINTERRRLEGNDGKDELRDKMLSVLGGVPTKFVRTLIAGPTQFVRVLQARAQQLEG